MNKSYNRNRIVKLIISDIKGDISSEDKLYLEEWIGENDRNRELYSRWRDENYLIDHIEALKKVDHQKALYGMKMRIYKKGVYAKVRQIASWSAAAAIFIGAVAIWIASSGTEAVTLADEKIDSKHYKGVVLTLSNGSKMDLTDEKKNLDIQDNTVRIKSENGKLVYSDDGESNKAEGAMANNELFVPRGAEYHLVLPDGTKVWLNSETRLSYPLKFANDKRVVHLTGEAYFEVAKNAGKRFVVIGGNQEITVLGTKFNLKAYNEMSSIQTTLVEGSVAVKTEKRETMLKPGEQLRWNRVTSKTEKLEVDVYKYTAWKDSYFAFDGMTLGEILAIVERWYDVSFEYKDNKLSNIIFRGSTYRYEDLADLLKVFEETNEVKFKRQGHQILVE